jgi:hypothetical protein
MEYICKHCNKIYKSIQSRSNHYRIYHNNTLPQNIPILSSNIPSNIPILSSLKEDKNKCVKCDKILSSYKNKWRHEQKCKIKTTIKDNTILELKMKNQELNNKFDELLKLCKIHPKKLQKINNQLINNTNNGTINNTVNIVKFGSEDFNKILSQSEILKILNRKMTSLEESIKTIHFNDKRPEFKNIYITNLKDQYAYVFDGNKFTVGLKSDILGELVDNHFENIEISIDEYKDKLQPKTVEVLDKFIEKMNNDMDEFIDNQHKKSYPNFKTFKVNLIKLMIYNETDTRTNVVNVICDKIEPSEINYL